MRVEKLSVSWKKMFCRHRERTRIEACLCFCHCLWPERKVKSDIDVGRDNHGLISFKDFLEDDGSAVGFFERPIRVGASILIYGRREGRWPGHCMAGPDWPGSLLVYFLIIMVHSVVLGLCSTVWDGPSSSSDGSAASCFWCRTLLLRSPTLV